MQTTAQGWLVLELTNSPALLGLTSAVGWAPTLFLSLFGGVLADRVDRRRLLLSTQVVGAVLAATLAVLTMTGTVQFWHVLAIAALAGAAQALGFPAFQAFVSTIVDRTALGSAVALNSAQFNLGRIVGPALAGGAIAAGGLAVAFWANAAALLLMAGVLASIRLASQVALVRAEASLWGNLVDGIRYLRSDHVVRTLVLLAVAPGLFVLNYLALMPVYARDILGAGATGLGLLTGAVGVGALAGALALAVMRPSGGSGRLVVIGLGVAAVALMVFAVSTTLPLSLFALAVLGAAQVGYYATTNTLIQLLVPARLRGRVLSLYVLTSIGVMPIGNLAAGLVAERFGPPIALAGGGLVTLIVVALVGLRSPALWRIRAAARAAETASA
jgi:MFS family permease